MRQTNVQNILFDDAKYKFATESLKKQVFNVQQ